MAGADTDNIHPFPVAPRPTALQRPAPAPAPAPADRADLAEAAIDALIRAAEVQERALARAALRRASMTRGPALARLQFTLAAMAGGPLGAVVIALCLAPAWIALVLRLAGAL